MLREEGNISAEAGMVIRRQLHRGLGKRVPEQEMALLYIHPCSIYQQTKHVLSSSKWILGINVGCRGAETCVGSSQGQNL